jgi:uncharacterized protein YbjT (DUF2867 family)
VQKLEKESFVNVFEVGAAGGIGRRLAALLSARGDAVTGMHRAPAQASTVEATGATPVLGDLVADDVDVLAARMRGHDAVVFSAGAHGTGMEATTAIDGEGLVKSATAAAEAGIRRFVLVSGFPDAGGSGMTKEFEHYMRVKRSADVHLAQTSLDWLIVRPGLLSDEPGDGLVSAGPALEFGVARRDNVAAFIAELLRTPDLHREIFEVTDGSTPVPDAVSRLVR